MPLTAICLLQLRAAPQLPTQGPVRVEALQDGLLLHTPLDFSDEPEELAGAVRALLGEALTALGALACVITLAAVALALSDIRRDSATSTPSKG